MKKKKAAASGAASVKKGKQTEPVVKAEAPVPAEPVKQTPAPAPVVGASWQDRLFLALYILLFVGAVTVTTGRATLVGMVAALVLTVRKKTAANLAERFSLPVVGLAAMMLMTFLAAIYSPFESNAVSVGYIILVALTMAVVTVLRLRKEQVPALLWAVMGISAWMSLIALDMASWTAFSSAFEKVLQFLGMNALLTEFSVGRLDGPFNNANVGASLAALGLLLGLYYMQERESKRSRFLAAFLLGINAVYFWMALSRGGLLAFAVTLVVYVLVAGKGKRIGLFFLMAVCVVVTVVLSAVATGALVQGSPVPVLMGLVCGPVIFLVNELLGRRVSAALEGRTKLIAISGGAVAAAALVVVVLAMTLSGPYTFSVDGALSRSVKLEGGEYTVSGQWDEGVELTVYTESDDLQLLMDKGKTTEYGVLTKETRIVIPEGAEYVQLTLTGKAGQSVSELIFSDGTAVKLDYTLLPETIAGRLQDSIFTSSSLLLRRQYMIDALKIWLTSPIYGRGLASTEGLYTSVQPAYYMSMYVHNHLIQYLSDMGILGLASFLMIMLGTAWLLIRRLRKGQDPLASVFVACLVMMNLHGLMELTFSVRSYLVVAMTLTAGMVVAYGEPLLVKGKKTVRRLSGVSVVAFWLMLAVFFSMFLSYRTVQRQRNEFSTNDYDEFMQTLEGFINRDIFCNEELKFTYMTNALGNPKYNYKAHQYAADLRRGGTYMYCDAIARFYYLPQGNLEEMFACSREAIAQKAADKDSWNFQLEGYRNEILHIITPDMMGRYLDGVVATSNYLAEYSQGRMQEIELTEENQAFLQEVIALWKSDATQEEAYDYLTGLYPQEETQEAS